MALSDNHRIRLKSSARTDRGMQRPHNEDSVHLWAEDQHALAVIADGMGGAVAGEEASRIAIETVSELFARPLLANSTSYDSDGDNDLATRLVETVREANTNIIARAISRPELKGMGTTLTLAFARHEEVMLAHVGDSRAYLVDGHDSGIVQLTADHSFVQALVDAGHITSEEADNHPMRNVLYRALGQSHDLDVDLISGIRLNVGDRIVLCSDGLTLHVKPHEIAAIVMDSDDPDHASRMLIDIANQRGGKDNISVVVIVAVASASNYHANHAEHPLETLSYEDDDDPTLPMTQARAPKPRYTTTAGAPFSF